MLSSLVRRAHLPRTAGVLAAALLLAAGGTCWASRSGEPGTPSPDPVPGAEREPLEDATAAGNPLARRALYVDPFSPAAVQAARWDAAGRHADAREVRKIADRPVAAWVTGGPRPVAARVDTLVRRAAAAGRLPVLVAYNIPHRDCGGFSGGGASSAGQYRDWIRDFARGIDHRPVVVILEPDAVAHAVDGCEGAGAERYALLRDAIAVLKATGSAVVYLDAGNPGWITGPGRLADALRRSGVFGADGFALNVANFVWTADNVAFGDRVSDALGGTTHFVVDTSRNGAGPVHGGQIDDGPRWCNPPGRALGPAPTTDTRRDRVDAFLWIKRPGESDGACRPGEPGAGVWWPEYALDLARRSG